MVLRLPSFRFPVDILFFIACLVLTADVIGPEIWGHGKTKDYPLWFWAGQQVLQGDDLYERVANGPLNFLYPPLPAILLAIPSYFGKIPLYLTLCLVNVAAWWIVGQLSNAMTGSGKTPSLWLAAVPGFLTLTFVFDMFDLGQPNLLLLAIMLIGFWWLQGGRPWAAGFMFALATAIKVFPVAVLPYLLWRRRWASAASMIVFVGILSFVVPAPFRGFERNGSEVATWYHDMVGTSSEQGFGQRSEQNWSWVNQSIIAVTHRLVRPVNYDQIDPSRPAAYVNVLNLDFKAANLVVVLVSVLIGLGFVLVMPPQSRMTPRSTAEELGILFCLMTVASPLARQYYFIWLFFPITVLVHRAAYDLRPIARIWSFSTLVLSGCLMALSLPVFPHVIQALGNNLAATAVIAAGLAWHLLNAPEKCVEPEQNSASAAWKTNPVPEH